MANRMILAIVVLSLSGCVSSRLSDSQIPPADEPAMAALEEKAKGTLLDPYSAVVEGRTANYDEQGQLISACFDINAKNVYGGYTGVQPVCAFQ